MEMFYWGLLYAKNNENLGSSAKYPGTKMDILLLLLF